MINVIIFYYDIATNTKLQIPIGKPRYFRPMFPFISVIVKRHFTVIINYYDFFLCVFFSSKYESTKSTTILHSCQ